jgi:phenylacetate-CoA ligase
VAQVGQRHPGLGRLRLVIGRSAEADTMTLRVESASSEAALATAIGETLRSVTKLGGKVELVAPGSLPNDGKVIEDTRPA